jgi:hypothetical protein
MQLTRTTEAWLRLGLAVALNLGLLLCAAYGGRSSDFDWVWERPVFVLSVLTVVAAVPLYWRGQPWQAALVLPLIVLPILEFYTVVSIT